MLCVSISREPISANIRSGVEKKLLQQRPYLENDSLFSLIEWLISWSDSITRLKVHKDTEPEEMEGAGQPGNTAGHLASGYRQGDIEVERRNKVIDSIKRGRTVCESLFQTNDKIAENINRFQTVARDLPPVKVWISEHEYWVICHANFPKESHLRHAWTLPYPPLPATDFLI